MTHSPVPAASVSARRSVLVRLLTNVWVGIVLLAAILIYTSVFSALAPVRWALELTEMQAFRQWFFVTLVVLLLITLLATTALRTRWTAINLGAITAHIGLLVLAGGALLYFGTKIEGDVLLESPAIVVRARLSDQPVTVARFRAAAQEVWAGMTPSRRLPIQIQVLQVETDGVQPRRASLAVQIGDQAPALLQLTPGPAGWQALGEEMEVGLSAPPAQRYFYDDEEPALYVRNLGTGGEIRKPIVGLPIYYERYLASEGTLRDSVGAESPSKRVRPALSVFGLTIPTGWFERWRMPIDVDSDGLPFRLRITGYVPFVREMRVQQLADGTWMSVPVLALPAERRPDLAARAMSAIRLELTGQGEQGPWTVSRWCLFSQYPDIDARPVQLRVPGSDVAWEVIYSRARHDLDAIVAARRLGVEYYPGMRGVRAWRSEILVAKDGAVLPRIVETNNTATIGRWTLFQSGFAEDQWSYSILGVGNRVGIWPMSIGWVVVTLGCLYAFYVKPVLLRRARHVAGRRAAPPDAEAGRPARERPELEECPA